MRARVCVGVGVETYMLVCVRHRRMSGTSYNERSWNHSHVDWRKRKSKSLEKNSGVERSVSDDAEMETFFPLLLDFQCAVVYVCLSPCLSDPHVAQKCTEHSHDPEGTSANSAHTAW